MMKFIIDKPSKDTTAAANLEEELDTERQNKRCLTSQHPIQTSPTKSKCNLDLSETKETDNVNVIKKRI